MVASPELGNGDSRDLSQAVGGVSLPAHTPGPWACEMGHKDWLVWGGDGEDVASVAAYIAPHAEESAANAHLIAAAPDHALVCWAMCVQDAEWEDWGNGKGEFCFAGLRHSTHLDEFGCPVLTANLRAAISKALGQATPSTTEPQPQILGGDQ